MNVFLAQPNGTTKPKHASHAVVFLFGHKQAKNASVQSASLTKQRKKIVFHATCLNSGIQQHSLANLALSTHIMIFLKENASAVQLDISSIRLLWSVIALLKDHTSQIKLALIVRLQLFGILRKKYVLYAHQRPFTQLTDAYATLPLFTSIKSQRNAQVVKLTGLSGTDASVWSARNKWSTITRVLSVSCAQATWHTILWQRAAKNDLKINMLYYPSYDSISLDYMSKILFYL
jgi:hypothetical protein